MGKYSDIDTGIHTIFSTTQWKSNNIATYPSNFENINGSEFLRVSIIPAGRGLNIRSISGILNIEIFSPSGKGPKRFYTISDTLDAYLVGKSKSTTTGVVQFENSALDLRGLDKANPTLYMALYSIPFNFYVTEA